MYDSTSIPLLPPVRRGTARDRGRKMAKGQAVSKEKDELDTPSFLRWYSVQKKSYYTRVFPFRNFDYIQFWGIRLEIYPPFYQRIKKIPISLLRNFCSFWNYWKFTCEKLNLARYLHTRRGRNYFISLVSRFTWLDQAILFCSTHYWNNAGFLHHVRSCLQDHKDASKLCLLRYDENQ